MILAFKVPTSCVHPGFSNVNDLHGFCRDHSLELQPLVSYWADIQQHHPEPPYGLLATTDGDPFPELDGSGPRSCGSSSSRSPYWSHLLFWLGPWVGLRESPVGGLRGLFKGPLWWSGEPDPQEPENCPPNAGSGLGPLPAEGDWEEAQWRPKWELQVGDFFGGARFAVTPLFGAPAGVALGPAHSGPKNFDAAGLKNLEFRSRAKTRVPWLEKWVPSLWKILSFLKKVAHESINPMLGGFTEGY